MMSIRQFPFAAMALVACGGAALAAQSAVVQRDYRVGSFDKVAAAGANVILVHLGGAPSCSANQTRRRDAPRRYSPAYWTLPPTIVYTTFVVRMSSSEQVMMSRDRTVMSASFPGASVPLMSSSKAA